MGMNAYLQRDNVPTVTVSMNSHFTGATIPEDAIVGRAFVIFWPVGRATWLTVPNTFDKVPDPT